MAGFRGRVLDHEHRPAPGKLVRFYRIDPAAVIRAPGLFRLVEGATHAEPKAEIKEARTDDEGRFQITGTWPDSIYLYEADADGEQLTRGAIQKTPKRGEIIDIGDIVLELHGIIIGRVVGPEGDPIPDALVRASDLPAQLLDIAPVERFDIDGALIVRENRASFVIEMPAWAKKWYELVPVPKTRTNADGEFRLTGVMPGPNMLVINKRNLRPLKRTVIVKPGKEKEAGRLRMKEGEIVEGRVVDQENEPVAGAEVVVASKSIGIPVHFASHVGPTKADGGFSASGFPPGEVVAAARTKTGEPWIVLEPQSVSSDLVIKVPSKHSLTIRIKSKIGKPIEQPDFKLLSSPGSGPALDIGMMGLIRWLDIDDRVEKLKDGRYRVKDLNKGTYDLAVEVSGHGVGRLNFEIDRDLEKEIELQAHAPFTVQVTSAAGKPVHNARIYVEARGRRSQRINNMPLLAGRTGKDGVLEVDNITAGDVRLTASHPAYGYAHKQFKTPATRHVRVTMEDPGWLTGILTENRGLPTPGKWSIVVERNRDWQNRGAMPDLPRVQVPDFEGKFEVRGLRAGKYRVIVIDSIAAVSSPGGFATFVAQQSRGNRHSRKTIEIAAGIGNHIEIDAIKQPDVIEGPQGRVSGTVMLNGRAAKDLTIRGSVSSKKGYQNLNATTDASGRFDLGAVRAGHFNLSVQDTRSANAFEMGSSPRLYEINRQLKDGEQLDLQILIETGRASGIVLGLDGLPVPNVRIGARGVRNEKGRATQTARSSATTDANGHFEFKTLPTGQYTFEIRDKRGHARLDKVEVMAGLAAAALRLQLQRVFTIQGRIDMSLFASKKPDYMWMMLTRHTRNRSERPRRCTHPGGHPVGLRHPCPDPA